MTKDEAKVEELEYFIGKDVLANEPLAKYTTYKIGGPAKYFFVANTNEQLVRGVVWAKKNKVAVKVISGGSNILISDQGWPGLIIVNKAQEIIFKDNNLVVADAGAILMDLVNKTIVHGLSGLEWAAGIPGSVGGAVRGNAGAYRGEMADNLVGVEIMRGSKQFILNKKQCEFTYRDSLFKHNNDLLISAEFKLVKGNKTKSQKQVQEIIAKRMTGQPLDCPSAGCVFKNVVINLDNQAQVAEIKDLPAEFVKNKKIPTAWLIDQAGLKGQTIGQAQVSDKHANFIVNLGGAKAADVKKLIELVKKTVLAKFKLQLEEEIVYLGF